MKQNSQNVYSLRENAKNISIIFIVSFELEVRNSLVVGWNQRNFSF